MNPIIQEKTIIIPEDFTGRDLYHFLKKKGLNFPKANQSKCLKELKNRRRELKENLNLAARRLKPVKITLNEYSKL
jgi:hypothetical protein